MKQCARCRLKKPLDAFSTDDRYKFGASGWCVECRTKSPRDRMARPDILLKARLKHGYGMTPDDLKTMFDAQEGRCAICRDELARPMIDHDHATGRVRALLCYRCNAWLAPLENELFRAQADAYLRQHRDTAPERAFYKNPRHVEQLRRNQLAAQQRRHA